MNRPTTESTYSSFVLQTSWTSEDYLVRVPFEAKGYHYPWGNKAFVELRHVLGSFYKDSKVQWTVKDFCRINKAKLNDVFELFEESWESCVIPSFKAWAYYRSQNEIMPANNCIRQEWTISLLGVLGVMLSFSVSRKDKLERDRAKAMLSGLLTELTFIETQWDYESFMKYIDDARCQCPDSHGNLFCYHIQHDLVGWLEHARID